MRAIGIVLAIMAVVAVSLATFGVGNVLLAGSVLITVCCVTGFLKFGTELIGWKVLDYQYKEMENTALGQP
jgi:hypothetical protein